MTNGPNTDEKTRNHELCPKPPTVFVRQATGLVREFNMWDAFYFNIALVGFLFVMMYSGFEGPLLGGDPILGLVFPLVFFLLLAYVFRYVAVKTPRTAADYVFVTRNLSPAWGFAANAGYFVGLVALSIGVTGIVSLAPIGWLPVLQIFGFYTNNAKLISQSFAIFSNGYYVFLLGLVQVVIMGFIPIFGTRVYKWLQGTIIVLQLAVSALLIIVAAAIPHSIAVARLNHFGNLYGVPNLYDNITSSNIAVPSYHDPYNTLAWNAIYVFGFIFIISPVYIAGEIKNIKKSSSFSIYAALLVMALFMSLSAYFEYAQWGYSFASKAASLSLSGALPIPTPYLDILEAVAVGNIWLGLLFPLVFVIQALLFIAAAVVLGSRLLLSYSLDRILPNFVADINEKYHSPIKAIVITIIAGLIGLVVFALPSSSSYAFLLDADVVAMVCIFPALVVCVAVLKTAWAGKEKLAIMAAGAGIPYLAYTVYQYLTIPVLGAATNLGYYLLLGSILVIFAIYYVAKEIRKRQGISFEQIFKEIPPE